MIFVLMGVPPLGLEIGALYEIIGALGAFHSRNMDQGCTLVAPEEMIRQGTNSRIRNAVASGHDAWNYESLYAWVHRRNVETGMHLALHGRSVVRDGYEVIRAHVRAGIAEASMPNSQRARDTVNRAEWHSIYDEPAGIDHSAGRRAWIDWCRDIDTDKIAHIKRIGQSLAGYTPEMRVDNGVCRFRLRPNVPGAKPEVFTSQAFYGHLVRLAADENPRAGAEPSPADPLPALPRPPRRMMI